MFRFLLGLALGIAMTAASCNESYAAQYMGYPPNAVPVIVDSGNVPAGAIALSMPATAGWTNYVSGVACTGGGATAASVILMVLGSFPVFPSGTVNLTWMYDVPAGATAAAPGVSGTFTPPLVGQDGGAVTLNMPSAGAGNTNTSCNMRGYRAPSQ